MPRLLWFWFLLLFAGASLLGAFVVPARVAHADALAFATPPAIGLAAPPQQGPPPSPTPPPDGGGNPITQIINNIIQFPFRNIQEALENAFTSMLQGSVAPMSDYFSGVLNDWLVASPTILTSSGAGGQRPPPLLGSDTMKSTWDIMVRVSIFLWPLTLALIAVIAAKDAVAAASWGIGDLKSALGEWFVMVLVGATSIYWMDWINRLANGIGDAIISQNFIGGFDVGRALANMAFGVPAGWLVLEMGGGALKLFLVLFIVMLALAVLSALIFQVVARFVILYVLVALAPIVMILSVLPPVQWLRFMWLKGFVLVVALGPINLLMLQLAATLAVRSVDAGNPIAGFTNIMGALGVLSILITIDGVIIKGVFGAVGEIAEKATGTVAAIVAMGMAAVAAGVMGGAAGLAGAGAAGAGAGAGGAGAGGAAGGAASAGAGTSALGGAASAGAGVGGPASIARSAFNSGAALRAAGAVMSRQGGLMGGIGAGMSAVGGTMEQHNRDAQRQAEHAQALGAPTGGGAPASPSAPSGGGAPSSPSAPSGGGAPVFPTAPPPPPSPSPQLLPGGSAYAGNLNQSPLGGGASAAPSAPSSSGGGASMGAGAPAAPSASAPSFGASSFGDGSSSAPPPQTASMTPMGTPQAPSFQPAFAQGEQQVSAAANALPPVPDGHVRLFRGVQDYDPGREMRAPYSDADQQRVSELVDRRVQGHSLTPDEDSFVRGAMNNQTRFYTDTLAVAAQAAGANGAVLYVDVPRSEAAKHQNLASSATYQDGQGMSYGLPHALYQLGKALLK